MQHPYPNTYAKGARHAESKVVADSELAVMHELFWHMCGTFQVNVTSLPERPSVGGPMKGCSDSQYTP